MLSDAFALRRYKPFVDMLSGSNPLLILDENFRCLYSSDGMFDVGFNVFNNIRKPFPKAVMSVTEISVYKDGAFYCMRIYPIKDEFNSETVYIGEIIQADAIYDMLGCMDIMSKLLPLYNTIEMKIAETWGSLYIVRDKLVKSCNFNLASDLLSAEQAMCYISSVCVNAYEFVNMKNGDADEAIIDVGFLCESCIRKCNYALAKCGRRVICIVSHDDLYVCANGHKVIVAVVNAVQNALLYSPYDTEPVITVCALQKENEKYIEICVSNENAMFSKNDFLEKVDFNFNYQRIGYGIPIIKAFVKLCCGYFSMTEKDGKMLVKIALPAVCVKPGVVVLRTTVEKEYKTGIPSFIDVMMSEVAVFFGTHYEDID